jgi:serine/threonine protein kinase
MNFVHLDIKPSNFLINANRKVKLTDFGVSIDLKQLSTMQDNDQAGDSVFMAPELLKVELPLQQRIT